MAQTITLEHASYFVPVSNLWSAWVFVVFVEESENETRIYASHAGYHDNRHVARNAAVYMATELRRALEFAGCSALIVAGVHEDRTVDAT